MTEPKQPASPASQAAWSGRFSEPVSDLVKRYTASVHFDRRMWRQDIRASLAHARMLAQQQIIGATDLAALRDALGPQVSPLLRQAALRRLWALDPAIRDFVGPADYAWDFNAPDGVPGFAISLSGEVGRLLAQAIGAIDAPVEAPAEAPVEAPEVAEPAPPAMPAVAIVAPAPPASPTKLPASRPRGML